MTSSIPNNPEHTPLLAPQHVNNPTSYNTTETTSRTRATPPKQHQTHSLPKLAKPSRIWRQLRTNGAQLGVQAVAVVVASVISVLDNLPYGILILPQSLSEYADCCVAQVLVSVAVAQAVFALGSNFDCALGCNIVENTPFLKTMAASIMNELSSNYGGKRLKETGIATILVAFMLSTLSVGLAFFLIAYFKLGEYTYCFPKQVLVGGIGGMGIYLVLAGIGVSCDVEIATLSLPVLRELLLAENFVRWAVTAVLCALLELLNRTLKSHFVTPLFLVLVPLLFPLGLAVFGKDYAFAVHNGWMFPSSSVSAQSFVDLWEALRFESVDWTVMMKQWTTMMGLVVFSVLHVPLNIPGLAMITGKAADVNNEFMVHAISNTLSGGLGCLQNYMVMSTSILYFKVGGRGRVSSLAVSLLVLAFFFKASTVLVLIPRCLGGLVCLHLGVDLMNQALVLTWKEFSTEEYLTVVGIMLGMSLWGFMEGLILGAMLAVILFVRESSLQKRVELYDVDGLRSRKIRPPEQEQLLNKHMSRGLLMVRVNGELFFGNSKAFVDRVKVHSHLVLIVIDCQLLVGLDCSGVDALKRVKAIAQAHNVDIIFASLQPKLVQRLTMVGIVDPESGRTSILCPTLNDALELGEETVISRAKQRVDQVNKSAAQECGEDSFERLKEHLSLVRAETAAVRGVPMPDESAGSISIGFVEGLSIIPSVKPEEVRELRDHFSRIELEAGHVIWRKEEYPGLCVYLERGLLEVLGSSNQAVDYTRPGQLSGELGICTGERRRYTLVTLQRSVAWTITRDELDSLDTRLLSAFQTISLQFASHRLNSLAALGHVHSV